MIGRMSNGKTGQRSEECESEPNVNTNADLSAGSVSRDLSIPAVPPAAQAGAIQTVPPATLSWTLRPTGRTFRALRESRGEGARRRRRYWRTGFPSTTPEKTLPTAKCSARRESGRNGSFEKRVETAERPLEPE